MFKLQILIADDVDSSIKSAIANLVIVIDTDGKPIISREEKLKIAKNYFELLEYNVAGHAIEHIKMGKISVRPDIAFIDCDFTNVTQGQLDDIQQKESRIHLSFLQENNTIRGLDLFRIIEKIHPQTHKLIHSFYRDVFGHEIGEKLTLEVREDDFTHKIDKAQSDDVMSRIKALMPNVLKKQAKIKVAKNIDIQRTLKNYLKHHDASDLQKIEPLFIGWATFIFDKKTETKKIQYSETIEAIINLLLGSIKDEKPQFRGVAEALYTHGLQPLFTFENEPSYINDHQKLDIRAKDFLREILEYINGQRSVDLIGTIGKFNCRKKENMTVNEIKLELGNLMIYQRVICTLWRLQAESQIDSKIDIVELCRSVLQKKVTVMEEVDKWVNTTLGLSKNKYVYPFVLKSVERFVIDFVV
jgi:hypothetical protein